MVLVEGKQQKRGGEKTVEMRRWQQWGNIRNAVVVVLVEGKRQKFGGGGGGGGRGYTYCQDIASIIDSSQVKNAKMLFCTAFVNRQSSSLRSICSGF